MGIRTSNKQKGAKESMKYPDISKAVEQEILASYDKLYRLAFSYVKNEQEVIVRQLLQGGKAVHGVFQLRFLSCMIQIYQILTPGNFQLGYILVRHGDKDRIHLLRLHPPHKYTTSSPWHKA